MNISVVVASIGRPENLAGLLDCLQAQTKPPGQVVLSVESANDLPPLGNIAFPIDSVTGPRGLCRQRNRGLDCLSDDADVVVFYDDDFVPSRFALEGIEGFFARFPGIAGADGVVLRDGINGPGIDAFEARRIVAEEDGRRRPGMGEGRPLSTKFALYGCNMAYRTSVVKDLRFDERLPLYAWLEDLDFGSRVQGRLVNTDAFWGVHCGEKRGRETAGRKLGYSQISNPVYMLRKGTLPASYALRTMARNVAANHIKAIRPEPWVNRRDRAAGNWLALKDVLRGVVEPQRILEI